MALLAISSVTLQPAYAKSGGSDDPPPSEDSPAGPVAGTPPVSEPVAPLLDEPIETVVPDQPDMKTLPSYLYENIELGTYYSGQMDLTDE